MRKEIQNKLFTLAVAAKKTRRQKTFNVVIIVLLALFLYLLIYKYGDIPIVIIPFALVLVFGGLYIFLIALPSLYQPLTKEDYAFREIAKAITILEELDSPMAYEEASHRIQSANNFLENITLYEPEWYARVNTTLARFIENMKLIVYPAVTKSKIKKQDLEEIAIALASADSSEIEKVNLKLETEPAYGKIKPPPQITEVFMKKFKENKPFRFIVANILSFFVVLVPLWFHSILFQTNLVDSFSNTTNFLAVLAIVIALGIGIYEVTKKRN